MANKWKETTLGEIGTVVTGKTPSTKQPDYFGGSVPFVTPKDMDGRKIISSTERYLTPSGVEAVKKSLLPSNAIIVSCIGSDMGKVAISGRECVTNQQINSIIINEGICTEYVYYDLSLRQTEIKSKASGSAVPILNKGHFSNLSIFLPSLPEQKAIAHILGSLDGKIELNRRMNQTFEEIAKAVFKSWFVDFDPVRTKAEGKKPKGINAETAKLFPDSFEDSELGKIPRGWEVKPFDEFVTNRSERVGNQEVPEYSSTNEGLVLRADKFKKQLSRSKANNKLIKRNDLVFGLSRQILNFGLMRELVGSVSPVYKIFNIDTNVIFADFVEWYMRKRHSIYIGLIGASSREGQSISTNHFLSTGMLIPPVSIQKSFQRFSSDFTFAIESINKETNTLTALRDTLLPKFISGEIRVKDVEKFVGDVKRVI